MDSAAESNANDESEVEQPSSLNNIRSPNGVETPSSVVTSPPPSLAPSNPQIYRTSSLPGGINERVPTASPIQLRMSTSRSRKKAQYLRNSVAVTNSDYLTQWKPQMMQLVNTQSLGSSTGLMRAVPSAPSLDTISEHELVATFQPTSTLSPLVSTQQQADPKMFRYTPTPVLDPARQTVPKPPSRPTTPVPPPSVPSSQATTPVLSPGTSTTQAGYYRPFSILRESSQAIPLSSDVENQFLPVFINPQTGAVYMFEDGYYIPLVPKQLQTVEDSARVGVTRTQPPVSDKRIQNGVGQQGPSEYPSQRYSHLFQDVPDYLWFVKLLMVLFALCCDFAVLVVFGLPALLCSLKVKKANRIGDRHDAKKYSEYTVCFAVSGIIFHIILVLAVITMFLMLHYVADVFS